LVRIEAWRTVSPCLRPERLSERVESSFRLDTESVFRFRTAVASDRLLPPTTYPIANPRSRFSSRVPAFAIHEKRSLTFHDAQARFGRIDASRRGLSPRDCRPCCFEKAKYVSILASGLSVAAPCFPRRPLRRSTRRERNGQGCVLPPPREGCRLRNNPRGLPSVAHAGSCPARPRSSSLTIRNHPVSPTNWSG